MNQQSTVYTKKTDWIVTIVPILIVLVVGITIAVFPDAAANGLWALRNFFVNDLGFTYIIIGLVMLVVSVVIACSRYGRIKLGDREKPLYSNFSWGAMIFTSTMAADVLYWSLIEWAHYYVADPFGLGAERTLAEAQDISAAYPLFHWGPMGWVFYILPAAALGFMIHVRKRKKETLSEACRPILGKRVDGWLGRVIDICCIAGLLAGCATIFSIATPMITSCISGVTGVAESKWITIGVLVVVAIVFTVACVVGMRGIQWVADKSVYLYILLCVFIFLVGPIRYVIETGVTSIGFTAQNFINMATWMDPLRISGANGFGFPQDWTIFFYANWISWSVATPMFIAKISEGRTLRNMILGGYAYGIAATYLSFIILGNYGLNLEVTGSLDISGMIHAGMPVASVIREIMLTLPVPKIVMLVTIITMIGLYATTFDATSLVLAGFSQKNRMPGTEPSKGIKILWSIILILLPSSMVFAESVLTTMQTVSIIAAFPIMLVELLMMIGFIKELRSIGKTIPVPPIKARSPEMVFDAAEYEAFLQRSEE